ncbi:MAG: kinase [Enhydrobacter sp.]|nr:kinase [Enhydrobacter sp.]
MIITRTPLRISFFGGGTDYPPWFRENGGAVLATTIDKYTYLHCRYLPPFFDFKSRIVWSRIEQIQKPAEIAHPAIRGVLEWLKIDDGVEIHHHGDLPARTGLGSSSSFTVGLLHALYALRGQLVSKRDLAEQAIYVEQQVLQENVGVQDQIQAAFGGFNRVDIHTDGSFQVAPLVVRPARLDELQSHLLLVYTGLSRHASEIAAEQVSSIPDKSSELRAMRALVDEAQAVLCSRQPLLEFGRLLHESWELKRTLSSKIAPAFVGEIYEGARKAGALGGKLLGAGGGGFMLLFVEPTQRKTVIESLKGLLTVPFRFERSGTQLVLYEAGGHNGEHSAG